MKLIKDKITETAPKIAKVFPNNTSLPPTNPNDYNKDQEKKEKNVKKTEKNNILNKQNETIENKTESNFLNQKNRLNVFHKLFSNFTRNPYLDPSQTGVQNPVNNNAVEKILKRTLIDFYPMLLKKSDAFNYSTILEQYDRGVIDHVFIVVKIGDDGKYIATLGTLTSTNKEINGQIPRLLPGITLEKNGKIIPQLYLSFQKLIIEEAQYLELKTKINKKFATEEYQKTLNKEFALWNSQYKHAQALYYFNKAKEAQEKNEFINAAKYIHQSVLYTNTCIEDLIAETRAKDPLIGEPFCLVKSEKRDNILKEKLNATIEIAKQKERFKDQHLEIIEILKKNNVNLDVYEETIKNNHNVKNEDSLCNIKLNERNTKNKNDVKENLKTKSKNTMPEKKDLIVNNKNISSKDDDDFTNT